MGMSSPSFTFGLVADVQYSDLDNSHTEARTQRYREAPSKLEAAVETWLRTTDRPNFVLNLGDTINGNILEPEQDEAELDTIARIFDKLAESVVVHHVVGNHCLCVGRQHLKQRLNLTNEYYSARLPGKWRLLVLDTTEMSGHSRLPPGCGAVREAEQFKAVHPLGDDHPHMSDWNGGISSAQLEWLREELRLSRGAQERVMVAAHHQAGRGAARETHLAWNWREIQATLIRSGNVEAYFAGHDHVGGYISDGGIHWVTVEAVLEAPTGGAAYAFVDVFTNRLEIRGLGVTSRVLQLKKHMSS